MRFRNHYACPCGNTWTDEWDATCDDRCPLCDTSCSPIESEDLEPFTEGELYKLADDVKPWRPSAKAQAGFAAVTQTM
jgi:hypothetical protein